MELSVIFAFLPVIWDKDNDISRRSDLTTLSPLSEPDLAVLTERVRFARHSLAIYTYMLYVYVSDHVDGEVDCSGIFAARVGPMSTKKSLNLSDMIDLLNMIEHID